MATSPGRTRVKWILFNLESSVDHERLQAIVQAADLDDPLVLQGLVNIAASDPSMEHRHLARRSISQIRERLAQGISRSEGGSSVMLQRDQVREALAAKDSPTRMKAIQALAACEFEEKAEVFRRLIPREKDPFVRAELVKNLVVLGTEALPLILEFLADKDSRVKVSAIEALESLGTTDAFRHVVAFLLDTDEKTRRAATTALNRYGKTNLLKVLGQLIEDERAPYRDSAVHALAIVRLPEALPLLIRALRDAVQGIRHKAAEGLELLAQAGVVEADAALEEYRSQSTSTPTEHTTRLITPEMDAGGETLNPVSTANMLEDYDAENRIAEIKKIIRLKAYERAAEVAARIKIEQDKNALSCMLLCLGRLKAREYIPLVKKYLKNQNDRIRANAVECLGLMDDRSILNDLVPFLKDPNNRVRVNAILALRPLAGHKPHEHLERCLEDSDSAVRRSALFGLLELRDDTAVELYQRALADADPSIRETAMEFLAILKAEGVASAQRLYEQAHAQGHRPPATTGVSRRGRGARLPKYSLDELLYYLKEVGGSDLHLNVGVEPCVRLHGNIRRVRCLPLSADDTKRLIYAVLNEDQIVKLEKDYSLDFSYTITNVARFRVNVFREQRGYKGVFRLVPMDLPTLDGLMLPPIFRRLCHMKQGLVLITGPTGCGKSTTLASIVNEINSTEQKHVITIEDPIEFIHPHRMSVISQRELGVHAHSFAAALRDSLREDPNVILVGEMRDLETMTLAVTASETGHLVFSTLHTFSAGQSINRIVDVFPPNQQDQARQQLSNSLQAIVSQRLIPAANGEGRVLGLEVMINTPAIANLIREGKTEQLQTVIQVSHESGMMTLDSHLAHLVSKGYITKAVALDYAMDRKSFQANTKGL